ncbi:MAG TPA: 30S ribosomal protein S1, partial [Candidatus Cloacimonadota bacterium]|nr:30S ribosomal protein S1 [Candidatus Cloacimonadota bacterium]
MSKTTDDTQTQELDAIPEESNVVENETPEAVQGETAVEEAQTETPEAIQEEEKTEEPVAEEIPVVVEPVEPKPVKQPKPMKPAAPLTPEEQEHNDMLSMIEQYSSSFEKGQIKEGMVVNVTDKEVMVDIGYKSEGVIPISEFAYSGTPERNSIIKVFINEVENGDGKISLSKKKADFILNIERIKQCCEDGTKIEGFIRRRVKGGMIVDIMGIEAFLPGSQMSLKPIPNLDQFIGKEQSFKVVSIDEEHRNIILSRKQVLEEEAQVKREELLGKLEVGTELDGEVKNITQYGAFVDLGGIDGLLHLTDMSWGKINHPSEMLAIGDKVKVKVIGFDPETNKISLGLKQLVPHPWENIEIKYPEGTRITGKVVSVKSFGAFIELEPGVEGLVHISEMSWTKKISDARKIVKIGDTINAIVLEMDKENRRISLGMKQMEANPWLTIEDRYPIGTVLTRKIKSLTAFGAFVEIEEGIDGLIHISDISWTKRIYHPREVYRKGQEVESVILSIDRALHRIALGVKQLSSDPWETLNQLLPVNSEVKGKISKLIPKGVLVDVLIGEEVVEGFIPISHLALPKLENSEDAFHVGEELPLKVIELDMDNRRLILSVKAFFFSRDPRLQEEYIAIHEQYMRERVSKLQKKKAEKDAREKAQAAAVAVEGEEHAEEPIVETEEPVIEQEAVVPEEPVAAPEAVNEEPVVEAEEPAVEQEAVVPEEPV